MSTSRSSAHVPDGGGWLIVGKQQGAKNRAATARRTGVKTSHHKAKLGTAFVHTVIDDYSRVTYAQIHDDEKKGDRCFGAMQRGDLVRRARRGRRTGAVRQRIGLPVALLARRVCRLGITHKRTRPYRPQTNGKIERFHRTLAEGWAFKKFYNSESARRAALPAWLHEYNHHRPHTAIGKAAPITRLNHVPGHHS